MDVGDGGLIPEAPLGIGIIGVGRTARAQARACEAIAGVELRAVAEIDPTKGAAFAERYGVTLYTDYRELLSRQDIAIAVILLPHFLHAPVACDALRAGKHVFIEKPMAMTTAECTQMIELAERMRLQIMVGHHYHFTAPSLAAKRLLTSGEVGDPVMAMDVWHKPFFGEERPAWFLDAAKGGGMWPMNASHLIDRLIFTTGRRVESVKAQIGNPLLGLGSTDAGIAFLQFSGNFAAAICHSGFSQGVNRFETEFVCTRGMLRVTDREVAVGREGAYTPVPLQPAQPMHDQFAAFIAALRAGEPVPTPGSYGRDVVAVLEATEIAARTGREVAVADVLAGKLSAGDPVPAREERAGA
ncbi:MAG TPA: Gfo/Idh/MocA family oxidoreductase [Limnochordia bacterium]